MKEFLKNKTVTYNLMSFTGFKALILFSLLMNGPKSYDEICDYFMNHPYLKEKISLDTLRVYLTSMKRVGCEIKRERIDGVSKYGFVSTPFELEVTEEQVNALLKVYKIISETAAVEELMELEHFMRDLQNKIKNPDILEPLKNISLLKSINLNLLADIISCADKHEQIVFEYNSPKSGHKNIEMITEKLIVKNGKIYLTGLGFEYNQHAEFLINRIVKINEIKMFKDNKIPVDTLVVRFEYYGDISKFELKDNEKFIENSEGKCIVEIMSSNEFFIRQRILSLLDKAKVIYPENYKVQIVECLSNMKAGYCIE